MVLYVHAGKLHFGSSQQLRLAPCCRLVLGSHRKKMPLQPAVSRLSLGALPRAWIRASTQVPLPGKFAANGADQIERTAMSVFPFDMSVPCLWFSVRQNVKWVGC